MSRRRLTERLKDPTPYLDEGFQRRRDRLEVSIRVHLVKLLNTTQGTVPAQPDYGMDLTDLAPEDKQAPLRIREAIKAAIDKYEPRLKVERIEQVESSRQSLFQFQIVAQLVIDDRQDPVFYHTNISHSGNIDLRKTDALP